MKKILFTKGGRLAGLVPLCVEGDHVAAPAHEVRRGGTITYSADQLLLRLMQMLLCCDGMQPEVCGLCIELAHQSGSPALHATVCYAAACSSTCDHHHVRASLQARF